MIEILSFYKIKKIKKINFQKNQILEKIIKNNVKGLIILSPEGINGTIAGKTKELFLVSKFIKKSLSIKSYDIQNKTYSSFIPFLKAKVKIKREVVPINDKYSFSKKIVKNYLTPKQCDKFIFKKNVKIIDARKPFEYQIGTFKKAINPKSNNFRDFKKYLSQLEKNEYVGMFCTGGIRCEKASNFLEKKGFKNVYMLKGGIINYFNKIQTKKSNWLGECFVFDNRVTIKKNAKVGNYSICNGCRMPISHNEMKSPKYKVGLSCPNCYDNLTLNQIKRFTMRHKQILKSKNKYKFRRNIIR